MWLSLLHSYLNTLHKVRDLPRPRMWVVVLFSFQLRLFAGGHRGAEIPVPIPNTEVKRPIAEGSAGLARARVGRRRLFFCTPVARKAPEGGASRAKFFHEILS